MRGDCVALLLGECSRGVCVCVCVCLCVCVPVCSLVSCAMYVAQTYDESLVLQRSDALLVTEIVMSSFFVIDYVLGLYLSERRLACVIPPRTATRMPLSPHNMCL